MNEIRQELLLGLATLSRLHPEMRLGQWMLALSLSATDKPDGMYDVEDEDLLAAVRRFLARGEMSKGAIEEFASAEPR